ncbi:DUF6390 family protein [Nocardia sp. NPDC058176]|uniref:DUF6390 family protein n=1 Tax=Nocardia sp. NPDC058176 TaxID=3346368 RepID=UPI0036DF240C
MRRGTSRHGGRPHGTRRHEGGGSARWRTTSTNLLTGGATIDGTELFARYAYAPNRLGYCGPRDAEALHGGSAAQIRALAREFSGAWPYLRVMAKLTGITDPLDHRLVESYWLGGGIGADLDPTTFTTELLALIEPMAGHYWSHLTADLSDEAAANHGFHVFAIYPWSRLLDRGTGEHPLRILDSCRITPATVVTTGLTVRSRRLIRDGPLLALSEPELRQVAFDDARLAAALHPGDHVALHWDHVCARLTPDRLIDLTTSTDRQLAVTNRRLSRQLNHVE